MAFITVSWSPNRAGELRLERMSKNNRNKILIIEFLKIQYFIDKHLYFSVVAFITFIQVITYVYMKHEKISYISIML